MLHVEELESRLLLAARPVPLTPVPQGTLPLVDTMSYEAKVQVLKTRTAEVADLDARIAAYSRSVVFSSLGLSVALSPLAGVLYYATAYDASVETWKAQREQAAQTADYLWDQVQSQDRP